MSHQAIQTIEKSVAKGDEHDRNNAKGRTAVIGRNWSKTSGFNRSQKTVERACAFDKTRHGKTGDYLSYLGPAIIGSAERIDFSIDFLHKTLLEWKILPDNYLAVPLPPPRDFLELYEELSAENLELTKAFVTGDRREMYYRLDKIGALTGEMMRAVAQIEEAFA